MYIGNYKLRIRYEWYDMITLLVNSYVKKKYIKCSSKCHQTITFNN